MKNVTDQTERLLALAVANRDAFRVVLGAVLSGQQPHLRTSALSKIQEVAGAQLQRIGRVLKASPARRKSTKPRVHPAAATPWGDSAA